MSLYKEGERHRDTHTGKLSREDGGRAWSDATISRGTLRLPITQKLRGRCGTDFPLEASEHMPSVNTLISDF